MCQLVQALFVLEKLFKNKFMKGSRKQESMQSKQGHTNKPIPEIRDNMDDRHNKEDTKNSLKISKKQGNKEPKK